MNKRIIPQLIRKGRYLIQDSKVPQKGLGFIVDANVFSKLEKRLGSALIAKSTNSSETDFVIHACTLDDRNVPGTVRNVKLVVEKWSTIDSLCESFIQAPKWDDAVLSNIRQIIT